MSLKPETVFIKSVNKYVKCHYEKNNNMYASGTPDDWYSGTLSDLWVEYKFVKLPAREDTIVPVTLSEMQKHWITGRLVEGRNVWVIVGCAEGGVIVTPKQWGGIPALQFLAELRTRTEIAQRINAFCIR